HLGEADRVVLAGPDRLPEVLADLLGVDVEGGGELDVAHVVAAELDMHQARNGVRRVGVVVVVDALHEGRGAVADADDRDPHLLLLVAHVAVGVRRLAVGGAHEVSIPSRRSPGHYTGGALAVTRSAAGRGRAGFVGGR